jgi:hypothetical protein
MNNRIEPPSSQLAPPDQASHNGNGNGNGHVDTPTAANGHAESKAGKLLIVTSTPGLAAAMRKLGIDASDGFDPDFKDEVRGRIVVVAYMGTDDFMNASQNASYIQRECHAEDVRTIDLKKEFGFSEAGESFGAWLAENYHFEGISAFASEAERLSKRAERFSVESVHADEDDDQEEEEEFNPVPDVDRDGPAFHGVLGRLTLLTQGETEANALFVLLHLLTFTGIAMGRNPHLPLGADLHHLNLGVGILAKSGWRKGAAKSVAEELFSKVDKHFVDNNILSGLNSGKGFLVNIRDSKVIKGKNGNDVVDPGVSDKRRVFLEPEFAAVLKQGHADTNPLLCYVRQALDGDRKISSLSKEPESATDALVSIIGHCNPADLKLLSTTDKANGTGGRFMWHFGARSKRVEGGGNFFELLDSGALSGHLNTLKSAIEFGEKQGKMKWGRGALDHWKKTYCKLDDERPGGPIGDLFVRYPTFILRPAMIFALTDQTNEIGVDHLVASEAIWKHQADSLLYLFPTDVHPTSDKILKALRKAPMCSLTRNQLAEKAFRKSPPPDFEDTLKELLVERRIFGRKDTSGKGRPAAVYTLNRWESCGR